MATDRKSARAVLGGQSWFHRRQAVRWTRHLTLIAVAALGWCQSALHPSAWGQVPGDAGASSPTYYTDPATGVVYQKIHRTVERPVLATEMTTQENTVYRPDTVVDVIPETRTSYTPVVRYDWEPRWRGRWNPFVQPTLQYEPVARTHWEARNETVERRQTRTTWVAERRREEVPRQVMRVQREDRPYYQAVGRVAPQPQASGHAYAQGQPGAASAEDASTAALVARLRPIDPNTAAITPLAPTAASRGYGFQSVASTTLPLASSTRSSDQTGMRATDLQVSGNNTYATPLPPSGVARGPLVPWWR